MQFSGQLQCSATSLQVPLLMCTIVSDTTYLLLENDGVDGVIVTSIPKHNLEKSMLAHCCNLIYEEQNEDSDGFVHDETNEVEQN